VGVFAVSVPSSWLARLRTGPEQARNRLLICPLVLVITLAVNVQSGPAVGAAHELLHHLYPFALLDQERCKRMPEGMPADLLCDPA
jgi:hypothetical protein